MFTQALNFNAFISFVFLFLLNLPLKSQDHLFTITSNPFDTKVLIAQKEEGNWVLVESEATLKKALEEEYYDGTKINEIKILEQNGLFYITANGVLSNDNEKIIRLSLTRSGENKTELYLTTKSTLESCYAVRCEQQDFADKTCICNEPTEFGISSYQAQEGFFLTKRGIGGLITTKRMNQSNKKTSRPDMLIPIQTTLGNIDGLQLTYNQERLHKAIEEEMVTTADITESFIVEGNEGKYFLLAKGRDGKYIDYARIGLNFNGKGELFITPSSTLELCRTNCGDVGSFTMGGECECLTTNDDKKDYRFTSKSNFLNTSAGIGSLFAEQK